MKRALLIVPFLLFLYGCTPVEKVAYRTVVGAKAFLDSVKSNHPECAGPSLIALCTDLRKAISAKDLLIDAGEVYCNVATFGNSDTTPCHPTDKSTPAGQKALTVLQNSITQYSQAEKDLKGVIQ